MKEPGNIKELCCLPIHMLGLIFYPQSPRYVGKLSPEALSVIPGHIRKVGVFVNENKENILRKAKQYDLQMIQLHGLESPVLCESLKDEGYPVIKAFSISDEADFDRIIHYENACDYFLFDTKTGLYGGSGVKFNWKMLDFYHGKLPFFLSGGIGPDDIGLIAGIDHEKLFAIDLNSRFESEPGIKDIRLIRETLFSIDN